MLAKLVVLTAAVSALSAPQGETSGDQVRQSGAAENAAPRLDVGANIAPNHVSEPPVAIISQTYDLGENGTYNFSFESSDGTRREESGYLKYDVSQPPEGASEDLEGTQVAQGSYSYMAPDGRRYTLRYIADENGFRVEGDHLPKVGTAPDSSSDRDHAALDPGVAAGGGNFAQGSAAAEVRGQGAPEVAETTPAATTQEPEGP